MNIFAVDEDPSQAARDLPDKLIVKMPTESTQMLAQWAHATSGLLLLKKDQATFYKITKGLTNHPCTQWLFKSDANVSWLLAHATELCLEYTRRYKKPHAVLHSLSTLAHYYKPSWKDHTPFQMCMPDQYKQENPVEAYRFYMHMDKSKYAKWDKASSVPTWWDEGTAELCRRFLSC